MATDLGERAGNPRSGWLSRWLNGREDRRTSTGSVETHGVATRSSGLEPLVAGLVAQDRYAFALLGLAGSDFDPAEVDLAWTALEKQMAMVPAGRVPVIRNDGSEALVEVEALYLDRCAVTNRQFARFVEAGCYDDLEIWPQEIWPSLLRFTDKTGQPGPAVWANGSYPAGKDTHPVTGVCWYEAVAYSRWVGKRLPRAVEWQKAGGWPEHLGGGSCTRYPWGDLFDPSKANVWASGIGNTAPVTDFRSGDTPNGIHQMSGNVWEWLDDPLEAIPCYPGEVFRPWRSMRRIIGGAFDTYLPAEATCHFITGQPDLDRRANIGFRCALSVDRLRESR